MGKFENIKVGDIAELTHVITSDDVDKFVELTGDDNKIHIDEEYASKTSFKKPVVHGMLGASFISTIIGTKLPGDGALWFSQTLEFLLPVRIGDTINIKAEVIEKIEREKIIVLQINILNQHRQPVVKGVSKVKVIDKIEPEEKENKANKKKVALIIGSTGGIGRACTLQLANDGFDLALNYNSNDKKANELKNEIKNKGIKVKIFKTDIRDEEQVRKMVDETVRFFGTITVLVNCSTVKIPNIKLSSILWDDFQSHLDVNIKGVFYLMKSIIPVMENQKYGKIIFLTTQYTESTPPPELAAYVTAKSALNGLAKALAVELSPKGITVNLISPGMTETELIADVPEKAKMLAAIKTPLRRLAKPEDVANAVSFLASDKSDYITGETIRVNGGQVMI